MTIPIDRAMLNISKMMLSVTELMPTRGEMLYHCVNMPWRKSNWQALHGFWGNTKRQQRKLRRKVEEMEHIQYFAKLAAETRAERLRREMSTTALGFDVTRDGRITVAKCTRMANGTVHTEIIHEGFLPKQDFEYEAVQVQPRHTTPPASPAG